MWKANNENDFGLNRIQQSKPRFEKLLTKFGMQMKDHIFELRRKI